MIAWREEFCEELAERGFYVIRFDNRDVGRSTTLDDLGRPDDAGSCSSATSARRATRSRTWRSTRSGCSTTSGSSAPTSSARRWAAMIAQTIAINHPGRVRSLVSIMGSTGARTSGPAAAEDARRCCSASPPTERAAFVEHMVKTFTLIGSPGLRPRRGRAAALRRGDLRPRPQPERGRRRQLAAINASGNRTRAAAPAQRPRRSSSTARRTRSCGPSGGRATAKAIPGATLLEIPGHGARHARPRPGRR